MRTLYITDLDGTLLNNRCEVPKKSAALLNALIESGVCFSVATARSFISAKQILEGLHLTAPVVLQNGVFLYDIREKRVLRYHAIDEETLMEALRIYERHDKAPNLFFYGDDGLLYIEFTDIRLPEQREFYETRKKDYAGRFQRVDKLQPRAHKHPVYISLLDTYADLLPITEELEKLAGLSFAFYKDTYSPHWFLEVYASSASKANGAKEVRELTNCEKIVAFGDNFNDRLLFSAADECYAVQNAVDELKRLADGVIGSNEEDGVAAFMYAREKTNAGETVQGV